jgi:hypothetical protein
MDTEIRLRILFFTALLLAFFLLPWWVLVPAVLAYAIYYTPAVEVIAFGFLADHLYGVSYTYTLTMSIVCFLVYFMKSYIRT